jgi:hypothetical protein
MKNKLQEDLATGKNKVGHFAHSHEDYLPYSDMPEQKAEKVLS